MLQLVADRLKKTNEKKEGKHDSFGKHVADELTNIPPEMVPYVKKIINMAIFEGYMKTLTSTSSIVTKCETQQPPMLSQQPSRQFPIIQVPQRRYTLHTLQPAPAYVSSPLTSPEDIISSGQSSLQHSDMDELQQGQDIQLDHYSAGQLFSQFSEK